MQNFMITRFRPRSFRLYHEFFLVCILGVTSLSKINAYLPYTEGWWSSYAGMLRNGFLPYKDFELLTPPGFAYLTLLVENLVGENFFALRIVGSFVQVTIGLLIFAILKKRSTPFLALIITIFVNVYLYSGVASITFDYNYFALLFILLGFYVFDSFGDRNQFAVVFFGFSLGISFLIKQSFAGSVLLFTLLTLGLQILFLTRDVVRKNLTEMLRIVVGFTSPILLFLAYAYLQGFLSLMLSNIFFDSVNAKGSKFTVLFGWILNTRQYFGFKKEFISIVIILLIILSVDRGFALVLIKKSRSEVFLKLISSLLIVCSILVLVISSNILLTSNTFLIFERYTKLSLHPILMWTHYSVPLFTLFFWLYCTFVKPNSDFKQLSILNVSLIWGCGLSGGVDQFGLFLPLGILFILAFDLLKVKKLALSMLCLIFSLWIAGYNSYWTATPYSWWGYQTSQKNLATYVSPFPYSQKLKLDQESGSIYRDILAKINRNRLCDQVMLTFPHMTSFGLDSGYKPYANQVQYWYDFTSPRRIRSITANLESNPPPVILMTNFPETVSYFHSILFNNKKAYTQEEMRQALVNLIDSNYVSTTYLLALSSGYSITVAIQKECL
jgi:hypothetical protein